VKKIAFIIATATSHAGHQGLTGLGTLQISDLILKAAAWFEIEPGQSFYRKVLYLSDRCPQNLEGLNLATGLAKEFADLYHLELLPRGWQSNGCEEEMTEGLLKLLGDEDMPFAFVFGYMARQRKDYKTDCHDAIDTYLSCWGIDIPDDLPGHAADAYMYRVDLEAKTVEYMPCVFPRE